MRRTRGPATALLALTALALLAPAAMTQPRKHGRAAIEAEVERVLTAPHPDRTRIAWAGRVLAGLDPGRGAAIARRAIAEGSWPARHAVAEALPFLRDPDRTELLVPLTRDPNWAVRSAALRGLAHHPRRRDGLNAALTLVNDPLWSVRWQAIRALASYPGSALKPGPRRTWLAALIAARQDPDPEVRAEAERVLLVSRERGALPVYLEIFDRESARPDIEAGRGVIAARALLVIGDQQVHAELAKRLAAPVRRTRILAARILQLRGEDLVTYFAAPGYRFAGDLLGAWSGAPGPERAAAEGLAHDLGPTAARLALPRFAVGEGAGARDEIAAWLVRNLARPSPEPGASEPATDAAAKQDARRLRAAIQARESQAGAREALMRALARRRRGMPREWIGALEAEFRTLSERAASRRAPGAPDPSASFRTELFAGLAAAAPFDDWPAVLEIALTDRSVRVRGLAALAWIAKGRAPDPYDRIGRTLAKRASDHFGRHFLRQAARRRDDAAFEFLLAAAQGTLSDKAKLKLEALNALTSVTWSETKQKRLAGWVRRRLRTERSPDARIRMVMLLGNLDPSGALDALSAIALDASEKPGVRVQTLNKLGASGVPAAGAPLRELLARPDPDPKDDAAARTNARLKAAAYRALFTLARSEDLPLLLQVVRVGPERTRRLALSALVKLRDPRSQSTVEAMTRNGLVELDNRARGLKVLAAIGAPGIADTLFKRLREESHPEMRLGALEALALREPEEYVDRLIHYLSTLRRARDHHERSRELFDEILGELGKVPAPAVTRFLIDMLLEHALRPDAPAKRGRRPDPLQIAARAALAGHGSERVTPVFDATLNRLVADGRGLGIRKTFYHDLVRFFSHPARRLAWSPLTADLTRRARRTPPIGTRHDAGAAAAVADLAFEAGRFEASSGAYLTAHLLAVREGSLDREAAAAALADDPVWRPFALSTISLGVDKARTDSARGDGLVRAAVRLVPYDAHVLASAVQAVARLGRDFEFAEQCLRTLGHRGRDQAGALARYDLGMALLAAGKKSEALRHLTLAARDHRPLREALAGDPRITRAVSAKERDRLFDPDPASRP